MMISVFMYLNIIKLVCENNYYYTMKMNERHYMWNVTCMLVKSVIMRLLVHKRFPKNQMQL